MVLGQSASARSSKGSAIRELLQYDPMISPPRARSEELLSEEVWLRRLIRGLVADEGHREDVFQETMLAAIHCRPRRESSLRPWLARVARNRAAQLRRADVARRHRELAAARAEALPSTADLVERASEEREALAAVLGLGEPYRRCLILRFLEGRSYAWIARELQVPIETVRTRIKRGLALVRHSLGRGSTHARYGVGGLFVFGRQPRPLQLASTWTHGLRIAAGLVGLLIPAAVFWAMRSPSSDSVTALARTVPLAPSGAPADARALPPLAAAERRPLGSTRPDPAAHWQRAWKTVRAARERAAISPDSIWPGFDFASIPIAVFEPGVRALLFHHDAPPDGFVRIEGAAGGFVGPWPGRDVANTLGWISGQPAALVHLASLRVDAPRESDLRSVLRTAAYAFRETRPLGWAVERAALVTEYPSSDPRHRALLRLERDLLRAALCAETGAESWALCEDFLAVRSERQAHLADDLIQFEQRLELNEGIASYIADRALSAEAVAADALSLPLGPGARGVRACFADTGRAQAHLLDRFAQGWKVALEREQVTMQELLLRRRTPSGKVLEPGRIALAWGFHDVVREERRVAEEHLRELRSDLRARAAQPGMKLLLDVSAAESTRRFDPMNVRALDPGCVFHGRALELTTSHGFARIHASVLEWPADACLVLPLPDDASLLVDGVAVSPLAPLDALGGIALRASGIELEHPRARIWRDEDLLVVVLDPSEAARRDSAFYREIVHRLP